MKEQRGQNCGGKKASLGDCSIMQVVLVPSRLQNTEAPIPASRPAKPSHRVPFSRV